MQLGPEDILLNLSVEFRDDLTAGQIEAAIAALDAKVRRKISAAHRMFAEAEARKRSRSPPPTC